MPGDYSTENPSARDRAEEAGAAKLWSVYADEAERYDKSLVASWKSDMEGMLIFAGLFSASLTAFLIESYKTLVQDPGDATVQLLQQVLAVSSSNSTLAPHTSEPFKPTTSSLVCNALWFISLGLSLSCALVATLLEQWARDFLHRANMRSSPGQRARIYSYLYYGLRRFKMHAVVEIIPSLLHAALLFFFCGLVVFSRPREQNHRSPGRRHLVPRCLLLCVAHNSAVDPLRFSISDAIFKCSLENVPVLFPVVAPGIQPCVNPHC
ncbi:hypothetical protein MIND_01219600 [Mycena indigotica]|uniref:DUF6535 domain-containing protein n=1 Tax=Mycena indigotica TaxID=2126181 RepID=A0A8H6S4L7_9AGAR|nr:uncharacterized protein MIND_01219600 [Mycena indigotica]KAF7291941.1 hypothetical protein MIND_01219600 [Mycena indigotica]